MDTIKVGKFIAECRKEKNLTQLELANKVHITDKAVSKWERGICFPDISLLSKLADELDVSISEILNGERIENIDLTKTDAILQSSVNTYAKKARKDAWIYMLKNLSILLIVIIIGSSLLYYSKYSQINHLKVAYIDTYYTLIENVVEKSNTLTHETPQNVQQYNQYTYYILSSSDAISRLVHYGREYEELVSLGNHLMEQQRILEDCISNVIIKNNCITLNPKDSEKFNNALLETEKTYLEIEEYMQNLGYISYSTIS